MTISTAVDPHGQTKNQHFLSQVEQRLNALNPTARPENQRIYEFEIVDREQHHVRLVDPNGRRISNSLSMFDLFSFDVADRVTVTVLVPQRHMEKTDVLETSVVQLRGR